MARTFLALVAAFTVFVAAGLPYSAIAQELLFPLVGRCPAALGAIATFFSLSGIPGAGSVAAALDCLLGIFLWLGIPGVVRLAIMVFRRVR